MWLHYTGVRQDQEDWTPEWLQRAVNTSDYRLSTGQTLCSTASIVSSRKSDMNVDILEQDYG